MANPERNALSRELVSRTAALRPVEHEPGKTIDGVRGVRVDYFNDDEEVHILEIEVGGLRELPTGFLDRAAPLAEGRTKARPERPIQVIQSPRLNDQGSLQVVTQVLICAAMVVVATLALVLALGLHK